MRLVLFSCFLITLLFLPARESLAATQYVSDQVSVNLRRGPGSEYKILKMVKVGTPLEVLQEGEVYVQVRHQDGTEGYVRRQHLTSAQPKDLVIRNLNREKERLQARANELENLAREWTKEKEELQRQVSDVQQAFQGEKSKRLAVAESYESLQEGARNVTELLSERDRLQTENQQQAAELKKLRQENEKILRKAMVQWFLAGGGVLFVGWMMGKRSRPKKRGF